MNTEQMQLIRQAYGHAQGARNILASKGAPFEQTAAGKLTLAIEALCKALLPSEAEQHAHTAFWAQFNAPEGRR
jgi:hypothetical protein